MKNIHVLPTEKPSNIVISTIDGKLKLNNNPNDNVEYHGENQHIYITNDEEIKEGDWYYLPRTNSAYRCNESPKELNSERNYGVAKIILTTDQDLIKEGVQSIDDEFLEWFVKNPSCESVEVNRDFGVGLNISITFYKIIIPQEEPSKRAVKSGLFKDETLFIAGARWQQEQDKNKYSEEDIPTNLESVLAKITHINDLGLSQWYEVVYYDNDKWCSYSGSKTFQDGEKVIDWKYCKDLI